MLYRANNFVIDIWNCHVGENMYRDPVRYDTK
jgi:hypothetical protein